MIVIYNLLITIVFIYIIVAKRKPDFLMVYILSSMVYYLPLTLGILSGSSVVGENFFYFEEEILLETYLFGILNLLFSFVWMFIKDHTKQMKIYLMPFDLKQEEINNKYINIAAVFLLLIMIVSVLRNAEFLFSGKFDKVNFISNQTSLETVVRYFGMYIGMYSFTRKKPKKFLLFVSLLFVLYTNLMGRRSDTVMIIIISIVFVLLTSSYEKHNILYFAMKYKGLFVLGIMTMVFVFPLKRSLPLFINGNFIEGIKYTFQCIVDPKTYLISESNSITLYVNRVICDRNPNMLLKPFLTDCLSVLPFGNFLTNGWVNQITYDNYFHQTYFPSFQAKTLAGSFWAECFVNGGFVGFIITINILCFLIYKLEKCILRYHNSIYSPFFMIVIINVSFYIHRLHLAHLINTVKYAFFSVIIIAVIKRVFKNIRIRKIIINRENNQ